MNIQKEKPKDKIILISACLLGLPTRYDGQSKERPRIREVADENCLVPVCPEQLGGLPTLRPSAEIAKGDGEAILDGRAAVVNELGEYVTQNYLDGAHTVLEIASLLGADLALLKEGSPACGVTRIKRQRNRHAGQGRRRRPACP